MAMEIAEKCNLIHSSKIPHVEKILNFLVHRMEERYGETPGKFPLLITIADQEESQETDQRRREKERSSIQKLQFFIQIDVLCFGVQIHG